jgi:dihydroorotase (multifunctional complex type)
MCSLDLVLTNGIIVSGDDIRQADIGISEGRIKLIGKADYFPPSSETVDVKDCFLLPGIIDAHVQAREPGHTEKEDFFSVTKAAAAGGVTTIICMPTTSPPTVTEEAVIEKIRLGEDKALVDFALQAGVNPDRLSELSSMGSCGVVSYEILLSDAPLDMTVEDNAKLWDILKAIADTSGLACVQSGDKALTDLFTSRVQSYGRKDYEAYITSRPLILETLGIANTSIIASDLGVCLHFRLVTTRNTIDTIHYLKRFLPQLQATVDVSVNHLLLSNDAVSGQGPYAKVYPPLRSKEDVEGLWQAIDEGKINFICSDHAPHTRDDKEAASGDVWSSPPGTTGVQTMLPLLLNEVINGRLLINDLVQLCSENPAKIFGLYPRKGTISIGSDADIVVVDATKEMIIQSDEQFSKAQHTLYDGWRVCGTPTFTFVRGKKIMQDGRIVIDQPWGRYIPKKESSVVELSGQ